MSAGDSASPDNPRVPLLELKDVSKTFSEGGSWLSRSRRTVRAVHRVSLELQAGSSLGLVGESGCGKSTLARLMAGLELPSAGELRLAGQPYPSETRARRRLISEHLGLVFQDPKSSLNPRKTARMLLTAPLRPHQNDKARLARARELLELVELPESILSRYPHELSGGQAQRLAIARALGPRPSLLVLDEALSSLDVSIQANILRLLARLGRDLELSYIFIGHDLAVVEVLCREILVMYLGSIVERASAAEVLGDPRHPYTQSLLSAVPALGAPTSRIELGGEPPSPADPPTGCSFHPRCPLAQARCKREEPTLAAGQLERPCACFYPRPLERS